MSERKINIRANYSDELIKKFGCYSFLNFASFGSLLKKEEDNDIDYFCDGMLMSRFISLVTKSKVSRVSFDFTSIAHQVLLYAEKNNLGVVFVGASAAEIKDFSYKITKQYPSLQAKYFDGYYDEVQLRNIIEAVSSDTVNIVIAGLGAGKQEDFIQKLYILHPMKTYFTCGGFIRQESGAVKNYYPNFIDKLNLRAFYRMYKEPHTIPRYFIDYPVNTLKFIKLLALGRIRVNVRKI